MTEPVCYCGHPKDLHDECGCCEAEDCPRESERDGGEGEWDWCTGYDPQGTWDSHHGEGAG